jgi:hypothetical protein
LNSACFNDVTHGNNGAFRGRTGADPCTGLGTPIAANLEERLDPATIHASRIRELIADNAQLRANVAQAQQRPCPCCHQAPVYGRPAALLTPRVASAPYACFQDANNVWWKFPVDANGEQNGEPVRAGPGECPLQRTAR